MPDPAEATSGPSDAVADVAPAGFTIVGHFFGEEADPDHPGGARETRVDDDMECLNEGCGLTWADVVKTTEIGDSLCAGWLAGFPSRTAATEAFHAQFGREPHLP